ncbi:MAG: DUF2480 family protein [Chitinophagales bacterium]|nr:DUF2480 family protein [Chitinophagales bacterium]
MESSDKIINKIAESGLITLDLEEMYPSEEKAAFDIKDYLFMGLILKEKDFRESLKNLDWQKFEKKSVAVFCSADAVVPVWAYMLVGIYLQPVAKRFYFCSQEDLDAMIYYEEIDNIDVSLYRDQRVIIKGCSDKPVPPAAYVAIARKLRPAVKSLMYGEACSNVPLYKQKVL